MFILSFESTIESKMVNSITHSTLSPIFIFIFLLLVSNHHYSAEAQPAVQPVSPFASPTTVWDVSSIGVIIGTIIATLILLFLFIMLIGRFTNSLRAEASKCENAKGINPQLLKTFPILLYSTIINNLKEGDEGPLQCAVCLGDYINNDKLRLLPQCNHVFHPPCIDAWLSSHVTCPVCRTNLNHQCSVHFSVSIDVQNNGECGSQRIQ